MVRHNLTKEDWDYGVLRHIGGGNQSTRRKYQTMKLNIQRICTDITGGIHEFVRPWKYNFPQTKKIGLGLWYLTALWNLFHESTTQFSAVVFKKNKIILRHRPNKINDCSYVTFSEKKSMWQHSYTLL